MKKNLAAYTAPSGSYPPYLSINHKDNTVEVMVRSPANADGTCGASACIEMPRADFIAALWDAARALP